MELYDDHLHSAFSFDGQFELDRICDEAKKKELKGITLTEHVEFNNDPHADRIVDVPAYQNAIEEARKKYPGLQIGMGLEVGLKNNVPQLQHFVDQAPWDFCIGSLHIIDGVAVIHGDYIRDKEPKAACRRYFRLLAEVAVNIRLYDVLGHLDLFRRAVGWDDTDLNIIDYLDELDSIFSVLVANGRGIELNTGGWRYHLDTPNPSLDILKRYRERGGEIITCGSDAHTLPSVGYRIADAYEILRLAGFRYLSRFEKRKIQQIPLF